MTHTKSYAKLIDTVRESGGDVQTMTAFAECVITAYKASLAQPAQEPTGMLHIDRLDKWLDASLKLRKAQRAWVGLTDKEALWLYHNCRTPSNLIDMVEAKLKEKNSGLL